MGLLSTAQIILSQVNAWWFDHDDQRLDELVARHYRDLNSKAANSGTTVYKLVANTRTRRKLP